MATYNKLVRDLVPERIQAAGETPVVRVLDDAAYLTELKKKLVEEASECAAAADVETLIAELADVEEVILELLRQYEIDPHDIEHERQHKYESHGGFEKKLYLEDVQ